MRKTITISEIQKITTDMLSIIESVVCEQKFNYYLVGGSALGAMRHGGPIPWDYDVDLAISFRELNAFWECVNDAFLGSRYFISKPGDLSNPNNVTLFPRIGMKGANLKEFHIDVFPLIDAPDEDEDKIKLYFDELVSLRDKYAKKVVVNSTNGGFFKIIAKQTVGRLLSIGINKNKVFDEYNVLRKKYYGEDGKYYVAPYGCYGYKNIIKKDIFGKPRYVRYGELMLPVPEKVEEYLEQFYGDWTKYPSQASIDSQLKYQLIIEE